MPQKLWRNREVQIDDWRYAEGDEASGLGRIIEFDQFLSEREKWLSSPGRLGVILKPEDRVEALAPHLSRFELVAARFSGPGEGRGYTQAKLLRERYGFTGELRAIGYVRIDQLWFMARSGFNSFELSEADLKGADKALGTFSAAYQSSPDSGLEAKLSRHLAV
jgi:uncharacterized protein (DUF934 family)